MRINNKRFHYEKIKFGAEEMAFGIYLLLNNYPLIYLDIIISILEKENLHNFSDLLEKNETLEKILEKYESEMCKYEFGQFYSENHYNYEDVQNALKALSCFFVDLAEPDAVKEDYEPSFDYGDIIRFLSDQFM